MDEVSGDGDAEIDDDILTIELSFHQGDHAVLKARRWPAASVEKAITPNVRSKPRRTRSVRR
jgi:hypothetical protein